MVTAAQLVDAQDRLSRTLDRYAARRSAEQELAAAFARDEWEGWPDACAYRPRLDEYLNAMKTCRVHGVAGVKPDGRVVIAWHNKCNCLKLCPDEARQDQVRVLKQYLDAILAAKREGYTIYKLVLSPPNVPRGELYEAKRALFVQWRDLVKGKNGYGESAMPGYRGALVIEEDPQGSAGDWNVHLNIILVHQGRLTYKHFRQFWNWQCEIASEADMVTATRTTLKKRGVDLDGLTDADVFAAAVKECIKYPVQAVSEKSNKHAGGWIEDRYFDADMQPAAPPMTEWPSQARMEWWDANRAFRRVRSYGCLYGIERPELPDTLDADCQWFARLEYLAGACTFRVRQDWLPENGSRSLLLGSIRRGISRQKTDGNSPPTGPPPDIVLRAGIRQSDAQREYERQHPEFLQQRLADEANARTYADALRHTDAILGQWHRAAAEFVDLFGSEPEEIFHPPTRHNLEEYHQ